MTNLLLTIAIVGATVVHPGQSGPDATLKNATILIEGDRITAVGPSARTHVPAGATVVRAAGKWVIPGLIDSHVHFFQSGNIYTRPDAANLTTRVPYEKEVARNKARLPATFKVWLASGVTGVVDVGGPMWNYTVRDTAVSSGTVAPRMAVAGPLFSMVSRPILALDDPPIVEMKSVDDVRPLAERELEHKPDFLKVWFIHPRGTDLAAQEKIVTEVGRLAHAAKVRMAVHSTELETAKAALRAGADVLVHSVTDKPIDDEFLALAKKNSVVYVPTLFVVQGYALALSGQWRATPAEKRVADPRIVAMMDDYHRLSPDEKKLLDANAERRATRVRSEAPNCAANLKKLWDAGITVAMGTDAGNIGTLHGPSVFREMALMVQAGLTPAQVLATATVGGATMLGRERDLGSVEPGKLADLVILTDDPLASVENLSH